MYKRQVAELLNITCPKCDAYLDPRPDGCIAMNCLHCRQAFCWMCFAECGDDAHRHALCTHGDYFPPTRAIESWHTRWRWRRIARLIVDGLPSRAPPCAAARDDNEIGAIRLTHEQAATLAEVSELLGDFKLWPFPLEQPACFDSSQRSPLIAAVVANDEAGVLAALGLAEPG